jgi:FemAB-related protein (PEP-CTERM system-associated)
MRLQIRDFSPGDAPQWDAFVKGHPQGSPFHTIAWKNCIERTFRYRPYYLAAFEGSRITGLLPLFLTHSFIAGKALISSPFAVYGGILSVDADTRHALRDHAAELGRSLQVQYIEFRNAWPEQCVGWAPLQRYVTFTQPLSAQDPEALLQQVPKKTRNMIRKSLKTPFEVRRGRDWRAFERLHSLTLRRLGTPSFPPAHFDEILKQFGPGIDICEVVLDGQVVGSSLSFLFRNEVHIYYAATDPKFNHLATNYRMYFESLLWAARSGFSIFDFGRCKLGAGTFEFKRHWDTTQRDLPYEILLVQRKEMPNFSPANAKFDLAIRIWRHIPLFVTRAVGPWFIRLFP